MGDKNCSHLGYFVQAQALEGEFNFLRQRIRWEGNVLWLRTQLSQTGTGREERAEPRRGDLIVADSGGGRWNPGLLIHWGCSGKNKLYWERGWNVHRLVSRRVGPSCSILSFFSFSGCEGSPVPVSSSQRSPIVWGKVLAGSWRGGKGFCHVGGLQPGVGPAVAPDCAAFSLPTIPAGPLGRAPLRQLLAASSVARHQVSGPVPGSRLEAQTPSQEEQNYWARHQDHIFPHNQELCLGNKFHSSYFLHSSSVSFTVVIIRFF